MTNWRNYLSLIIVLAFTGCYPVSVSLRDGSVPLEWKRFTVYTLSNEAANAPISYPPELSEQIKDAIQNRVGLRLVNDESEDPQVVINGIVKDYSISPIALQGDDLAAKNRLTVQAKFEIFINAPTENLMELNVSRFVDFDSNLDVGSNQAELLQEISEQIIQDVLNKLLSNW